MAARPPFPIGTGTGVPYKGGLWYGLDPGPTSDGEQRHWPGKPLYRLSSDVNYRIKLGTALAEDQGILQVNPGNYYLSDLPHGYGTFETDQPGGGGQIYKRLFGHPSGRYYDSVIRFQVHFFWLVSGMEGDCQCVLCGKKTAPIIPRHRAPREVSALTVRPRRPREVQIQADSKSSRSSSTNNYATLASGREKRQHKSVGEGSVDEESTPDVFKEYLKRLYRMRDSRQGIEDDITEEGSFDWRAERDLLAVHFTQIELQHSFIPRIGELVLWCNYFPDGHYLTHDISTNEYKFYSFEQECYHGFPDWRGGIVTAVPSTSPYDSVDFPDILDDPPKQTNINASGFRVETLPDPNSIDKSLSKQYRYVSLRHIRPLSQWQLLLRGIPQKKLHSSIYNALTCMTSVSLLGRFWCKGIWPDACVKCKGIYIGSELIMIGDTIRIEPPQPPKFAQIHGSKSKMKVTDVLIITSIRLNLEDIKPEHLSDNSRYLSSRSTITIVGNAYTLDVSRGYHMPSQDDLADPATQMVDVPKPLEHEKVKTFFRPVRTGDYGEWYPLHPEHQRYEVSFERVLGRLYEADAVRLWTGLSQTKTLGNSKRIPTLDFDVSSIIAGRAYATATDERIPEPTSAGEILWHWADTRALGLALETVNGLEVGPYHDIRDRPTLRAWRAMLKIIDGGSLDTYGKDTGLKHGTRGRKKGSKMVNGRIIGPDAETESDEGVPLTSLRRMSFTASQSMMAAAAMAGDESSQEESVLSIDDDKERIEQGNEGGLALMSGGLGGLTTFHEATRSSSRSESRPRAAVASTTTTTATVKFPQKTRTKEQIMTSIEFEDALESEQEEALAFLDEPIPLARGGTEESEGGDYNPRREDVQKQSTERSFKRVKYAGLGEKW